MELVGSKSQGYAIEIEHIMTRVFACDRYGVGAVVNSDFIRKNPLAAILTTCGFLYATEGKRDKVEKFITDSKFYLQWSLDELLSFKESSRTMDNAIVSLDYENGEIALKSIIDAFRKLCEER